MRVILAVLCGLFAVGYYFLTAWYPDMNWLQSTGMTLVYPSVISAVSLILMATARRLFARDPVLSAWAVLGLAGCLLIFPLIGNAYTNGPLSMPSEASCQLLVLISMGKDNSTLSPGSHFLFIFIICPGWHIPKSLPFNFTVAFVHQFGILK